MIDLQSNELRPDDDDRLSGNRGKSDHTSSHSRRYMMIILGIVVLVLLIILIVSMLGSHNAIKTPSTNRSVNVSSTDEKRPRPQHPNEIHIPLISDTTTETGYASHQEETRIEIPGEVVDSLENLEKPEVNSFEIMPPPTTTAKTVNTTKIIPDSHNKNQQTARIRAGASAGNLAALKNLPSGNVTIQLSGASRYDSLATYAKQNELTHYWIYETQRNGNPWYVLIMGNYPNSSSANKAIADLPEKIRNNKPWVKSIRQVHKELNQN